VAGVLLLSGGLAALQTISIVAALPFMILMIFMAASLLKALRGEIRQKELHDAIMYESACRSFSILTRVLVWCDASDGESR